MWRACFYHGNGPLASRKRPRPIFSRCAGDLQRPLFITPLSTAKKPRYTPAYPMSADPLEDWILVPTSTESTPTRKKNPCFYGVPVTQPGTRYTVYCLHVTAVHRTSTLHGFICFTHLTVACESEQRPRQTIMHRPASPSTSYLDARQAPPSSHLKPR